MNPVGPKVRSRADIQAAWDAFEKDHPDWMKEQNRRIGETRNG